MIEIFGYVAGVLAIVGVLLNNRRMRCCFYVWIVSNFMRVLIDWWAMDSGAKGMMPMLVVDAVFLVLAFEGLVKWKKKDKDL